MKQKRLLPLFLCLCLLFVLPVKVSAADNSEQETSAAYLREQGIMVGDGNGEMNLDSGLTRAQLAHSPDPPAWKPRACAGRSGILYRTM